jgi:hypothetical protein
LNSNEKQQRERNRREENKQDNQRTNTNTRHTEREKHRRWKEHVLEIIINEVDQIRGKIESLLERAKEQLSLRWHLCLEIQIERLCSEPKGEVRDGW